MRIVRLRVENYRALRAVEVDIDPLTAVLGENNSGKSCLISALNLFFSPAPKVDEEDFTNDNTAEPIRITVTFADLTPSELELFATNLIDDSLVVTRTLIVGNPKDSGVFSVDAFVNPQFAACRAETGKNAKRDIYKELQNAFDLPNVKSADEIDDHLETWEQNNPDGLVRMRVGGFRGFKNVAVSQLRRKTDFIFVPAVREAADDVAAKSSPVRDLLNTLARQTIENMPAYQEFVVTTNNRIAELTDPANVPALAEISEKLTELLAKYYKDSHLIASWLPITEVPIDFPSADISVRDHGYVSDITRVGHGLQRAIILTVLEYISRQRATEDQEGEAFDVAQSDIVIGIEEPEIYQHPTKQRLFLKVLQELTNEFSTATGIRLQIIFVTHSPLFVELARCADVRLARRVFENEALNVVLRRVKLSECIKHLGTYSGTPPQQWFTEPQFASKLHVFTPEIAEGFFARAVILVEGVSDRAILEAYFSQKTRSPLAEGIVIANADGKKKIEKPAIIFRELGIPIYIIFDNDAHLQGQPRVDAALCNRVLQQIAEANNVDDFPDATETKFACWEGNLENYLKSVVGDAVYLNVQMTVATQFGVSGADCVKSPFIAAAMLAAFIAEGHEFPRLEQIIARVDAMLT